MSFQQIRQERQSAAELLSLMSFFNPQGIPEPVLRRHNREAARGTGLEDDEDTDSAFDEDLDTLRAYSLVSTTAGCDACEMHALVQFCTRVWLSSFSDAGQWEQRFIALMAQELPSGVYENQAKCQQLLPHVEPLFSTQPANKEALEAWAQVLTNAAWYLWRRGSYSVAQHIAAKAVAASGKALGLDDHQTLSSVVVLALVLRAQGKYGEAETLNRRALEGSEKKLGEGHPDTLESVNNLAGVLQALGKYGEAERLSKRALEGLEKELGEHHPTTLTSVYCLAHLLHTLRQYPEAAELYQRACDGYTQQLVSQHLASVARHNHFAAMQQAAGQPRLAQGEGLSPRQLRTCF
jgi:tetratricopeptide (TPR) repeat protein